MKDKLYDVMQKQRVMILVLFVAGLDIVLLVNFLNRNTFIEHILIVIIAVILNAISIFYINLIINAQSSKNDNQFMLSNLMNTLDYAEALELKESLDTSQNIEEEKESVASVKESDDITDKLQIKKPNEILKKKHIYDKAIEPTKYLASMSQYMQDNGINVDMNQMREMFACMATSKLIIFTNNSAELTERFIELFFDYIGASVFVDELQMDIEQYSDLYKDELSFRECMFTSKSNKNSLNAMVFNHVDLLESKQVLKEIIDLVLNQSLATENHTKDVDTEDYIPANVWFLIIANHFDHAHIKESMPDSAIMIDLEATLVKPKEKVYENELKLTFEHFMNLLYEGYENYYLEEEDWKKIDEVENHFKNHTSFKIDNILFRQLERYTSTFLMFGGDNKIALDNIMFSKLLRLIYALDISFEEESEVDVLLLFEELFGLENLTKSKNILKEIQAKSNQNSNT